MLYSELDIDLAVCVLVRTELKPPLCSKLVFYPDGSIKVLKIKYASYPKVELGVPNIRTNVCTKLKKAMAMPRIIPELLRQSENPDIC